MPENIPDPEEIAEWQETAARRNAILPSRISVKGRQVDIICGHCESYFARKLLPNRNDPVYVCPDCGARNYLPIKW